MEKDNLSSVKHPLILIFTDVDGTLLDHNSYQWDKAGPALDLCRIYNIPVIMVSSKTRSELEILRRAIGLTFPFISENGGGIFFPKEWHARIPPNAVLEGNLWKYSVGTPYRDLVEGLGEIRLELGLKLRGFSDMTPEEISGITGLDTKSSALAAMREFDEPFIMGEEDKTDLEVLSGAAKKRGFQISKGGRFYHIHGRIDKGDAVRRMISWHKESQGEIFTVALGDSPNDFPMFEQVDQPVLIRPEQGLPDVERKIPRLIITRECGPEGWNAAVTNIIDKKVGGIPSYV
jgi:mannosyl-3-phosphoglycerate phosphatase